MTGQTLLVVDDEPQIHRFLRPALEAEGYRVLGATSGAEALRLLGRDPPDLILLDLGLPDIEGQTLLADLRALSRVPIIVVSARDQEREKIAALDSGANDYVEKPFGLGELLARIRGVLRWRVGAAEEQGPRFADIALDSNRMTVTAAGETHELTRLQFRLLAVLVAHRGRVLTHGQILKSVWGPAHDEDFAYLRVYIGQLRRRLGAFGEAHVKTRPGVGYYFE
ncbi:MAG: response regulator transcription factor [Rhodospirillales bacterium]|nr:response regulator transcription factor [Rhodospirillales bacterium]